MAALVVGSILMGVGALAKAVPAFIPNKERRERIDELETLSEQGLTKEEESELAALMAASDASQNKAILNTIQETAAGSGQISGADAIQVQKVTQEQAAKASAQRGQVIAQADQAAKDAAAMELAALQADEQQWKDNRLQTAFNIAGDTAQIAGAGAAGGLSTVGASKGEWDWGLAGQSAMAKANALGQQRQQVGYNPNLYQPNLGGMSSAGMQTMTPDQRVQYMELMAFHNDDATVRRLMGIL